MANAGLIVLSILTLNIWALPDLGFVVASPLREDRISEICKRLKNSADDKSGFDVVLLQEVWRKADRAKLSHCGYAHTLDADDADRPIDSGLLLLSKYPILKHDRLTFPVVDGVFTEGGEDVARKSVVLALLELSDKRTLWVANTHLVSCYNKTTDALAARRKDQLTMAAKWVTQRTQGKPFVFGGDLNITHDSSQWAEMEKLFPHYQQAPQSEGACTVCPPNSQHEENEGKVDHLIGMGTIAAENGRVAFDEPMVVDGTRISISDHFGWHTQFIIGSENH